MQICRRVYCARARARLRGSCRLASYPSTHKKSFSSGYEVEKLTRDGGANKNEECLPTEGGPISPIVIYKVTTIMPFFPPEMEFSPVVV